MTIGPCSNHSETIASSLEKLKAEVNSLDGWKVSKKSGNLTIYNKPLSDSSLPALVRGDITFTPPPGATPFQILGAAVFPGCRLHWDSKTNAYKIHKYHSKSELLVWSKHNAPWPISARDFSFMAYNEGTAEEQYCALVSVKDEAVPEVSGCVRANMMLTGWKIYKKNPTEMSISFVNQADWSGSLPTSFTNKLATEIPAAAANVVEYVKKFGFPPSSVLDDKVDMTFEDFNHDKALYTLEVNGRGGSVVSTVSSKMYPNGFSARLEGDGKMIQEQDKDGNTCIQLESLQGPVKLIIEKK